MRLNKRTGLKAAVLGVVLALFGGFYGLVKADPHISTDAAAEPAPTATPQTVPNYGGAFSGRSVPQTRPSTQTQPQQTQPKPQATPHTRSRAS